MRSRSVTPLRYLLALIAVIALVAVACGNGDDDAKEEDTTEATGETVGDSTGVTDDKIILCSSLPLSGAFGLIGTPQVSAIDSYFQMVNDAGGVHGREIEWITYDDAFDGAAGLTNIKRCVEEDGAFAVGPGWNSFTTTASISYLEDAEVPYLFADGATIDQYASDFIFPRGNLCDSLAQDITDRVIEEKGAETIGVIYINNDIGKLCEEASKQVADELGAEIVVSAVVEEDTADYTPILTRMRSADVDAIIIHGGPMETVKTIQAAERQAYTPDKGYACSGGCALNMTLTLAGPSADGMISNVPTHRPSEVPEGELMIETIGKYYPDETDFDVFTIGGWGYAKMLVDALEEAGPDLTREKIMETLRAGEWDDGFACEVKTFDPPLPNTVFLPVVAEGGEWVEDGDCRDISEKYDSLLDLPSS